MRTRRICERYFVEAYRARDSRRQLNRRCCDCEGRLDIEQFSETLGCAGGALNLAPHFGHYAGAACDYGRVEDERRKFSRSQPPREHIVPSDPEDYADRAKGDQHDERNQPRFHSYAFDARLVCRFGGGCEAVARAIFVQISLHRAHFVQRLIDMRRNVRYTVLIEPRQAPHASAHQQNRNQRRRHPEHNESSQFCAGREQHPQRPQHEQRVAQKH